MEVKKDCLILVTIFLLAGLNLSHAGCRYTNPQWMINDEGFESGPKVFFATSSDSSLLDSEQVSLTAFWNLSLVEKYSQCVDTVEVMVKKIKSPKAKKVMLCNTTRPSVQTCTGYLAKNNYCGETLDIWVRLLNKDHKDGVQPIGSPTMTRIESLECDQQSNPDQLGSPILSQSCESLQPTWIGSPDFIIPEGSKGKRFVNVTWANQFISSVACIDELEIKYWEEGTPSNYHKESLRAAHTRDLDHFYHVELDVKVCKTYSYILKAMKNDPYYVATNEGKFSSKCDDYLLNSLSTLTSKIIKATTPRVFTTTTRTTTTTTSTSTITTTSDSDPYVTFSEPADTTVGLESGENPESSTTHLDSITLPSEVEAKSGSNENEEEQSSPGEDFIPTTTTSMSTTNNGYQITNEVMPETSTKEDETTTVYLVQEESSNPSEFVTVRTSITFEAEGDYSTKQETEHSTEEATEPGHTTESLTDNAIQTTQILGYTETEGPFQEDDHTGHTNPEETATTTTKLGETTTTEMLHFDTEEHHDHDVGGEHFEAIHTPIHSDYPDHGEGGEHFEAIHAPIHSDYPDYMDHNHPSMEGDDHMNATLQNQLSLIAQIKHGRYLMAQPDFEENGHPKALELNALARGSSWSIHLKFHIIFTATLTYVVINLLSL